MQNKRVKGNIDDGGFHREMSGVVKFLNRQFAMPRFQLCETQAGEL